MKRLNLFVITTLIFIINMLFTSCPNDKKPEPSTKTTIKGVAKINDAFVPKDAIIQLFVELGHDASLIVEDITVSDDEGHFESKNQYVVDTTGKVYALEKKGDEHSSYSRIVITDSSVEDKTYNFVLTATMIKGVAKIYGKFVEKGTKIQLFANGTKVEDIAVSDNGGHFESTNQFDIDTTGKVYVLKIEKDEKVFSATVTDSSAKDAVYNFAQEKPEPPTKTTIKGVAKINDAFVPKDTIIQLFANGTKVEDITVGDDKGHFKSTDQYNIDKTGKMYVLKINDKHFTARAKVFDFSIEDAVYDFKKTEATIKGVAKINDAFVPKDTIIQLYNKSNITYRIKREDIIVSDDEGHFESKKQYDVNATWAWVLEIKNDGKVFGAGASFTDDAVYDFVLKTTIKGVAKIGDAFVRKGERIHLVTRFDYPSFPFECECMTVSDDEGHFESHYLIDPNETLFLKIVEVKDGGGGTFTAEAQYSTKEIVYNFTLFIF